MLLMIDNNVHWLIALFIFPDSFEKAPEIVFQRYQQHLARGFFSVQFINIVVKYFFCLPQQHTAPAR